MEDQDPGKTHVSGLGVHHCQKCGWPFPNPHPSARHRRAHKRLCGTIQGYTLVGSSGRGDDDDHHSDLKTPIQKALHASNERNIGGIGAVSSRSDEDVFSDASEFLESSSCISGNLTPYQSFKDCANIDIIQSPESSSLEHTGEADEQTSKSEKSVVITHLTDGIVQSEKESSQGFKVSTDLHIGQQTDAETEAGVGAEKSLMDAVISQSKHADVTCDAEHELETQEKVMSHTEPTDELSKHIIGLDTAQVDATQTTNFQNSNDDCVKEGHKVELEHEISVSDDIPLVNPAEFYVSEDHNEMVHLHQPAPLASGGTINEKENEIHDSTSGSKEWRESVDVSASGVHLVGDRSKSEDRYSKPMFEEEVNEEDVLQVIAESDKVGDLETTENEKDLEGCSVEKHHLKDTCDDFSQAGYSGTEAFSDVCHVVAPKDDEVDQTVNNDVATAQGKTEIGLRDMAGGDNGIEDDMECCTESVVSSFETASHLSKSHVTPGSGLPEDDNVGHNGREETESFDISEVHSGEKLSQENLSTNANSMSDLISDHQEVQVFVEHVNDDCSGILQERDCKDVDHASKILEDDKASQVIGTEKAQVSVAIESENGRIPNSGQTSEDKTETEYSEKGLKTDYSTVAGSALNGVGAGSLHKDLGTSVAKPQLDTTAAEFSVESNSRTDSMEGNWGSISGVSNPSDIPTGIDADALPSTYSQPSTESVKANLKKPDGAPDGAPDVDKSNIFEPPSFMTLVEPGVGATDAASEFQTGSGKKPEQLGASEMQAAGWFPTLTHAPNESQGRKRNEEIIAKVTNWNVKQQQHTPLKNLLGEVKSPNPAPGTVMKRDEKPASLPMKVSSILGQESTADESGKTAAAAKEWDSPARYPANIKRETNKKVKGKRHWVQFVCCLSVN